MILHEKGKNLIKEKQYLKALIVLAEADNEFKLINFLQYFLNLKIISDHN